MVMDVLRSVSLRDDIAAPTRLKHYHPTSRSLPVTRAVLSGGATMVIAAYGSGKSLAAGIGSLAVANDPASHGLLKHFADKMTSVDRSLADDFRERIASSEQGRVVILTGHVRDLASSLAAALGLGPCENVGQAIKAAAKMEGADRIAIVWDEFGRHLEALVAEGRSRELDDVQRLAEWAVRARKPTLSFTLLLHQNLLAYASNLNQTTRNEWRKIEGRLEQVRFVEDSRELYGLIAEIVSRRKQPSTYERSFFERQADGVVENRWLDGMSNRKQVMDLLIKADPLTPAALQVVPRLAARVGQNERSLFSFVEKVDLSGPVGMDEVYVAFSEAMRSDVGIGGSHRRWLEAETARSKVTDPVEREVLAAAFLMQMGVYGERRHLPRSALEFAVKGKKIDGREVTEAVDALIARKLLIYRKLTDDVSIWHGADVDVAGRLGDERLRRLEGFDLLSFLSAQHAAPYVRAVRHNVEHGTTRYLEGSYVTSAELDTIPEPGPGVWGRIAYVICNSADDVRQAREAAAEAKLGRTILVVPDEPLPILDSALEIEALKALRHDDNLLSEDPLVAQEIDELLAVARRHLAVVMHHLTTPRPAMATWFHDGRKLDVSTERSAGVVASTLMDEWFPLTPKIINDQIMRGSLSRQMQTARIRVVTRVMEHAEEVGLGYADTDSSAEASVYRTVLARTGLHISLNGRGRFVQAIEIEGDAGLRRTWEIVQEFFTAPGLKPLATVIDRLAGSPIGLPPGVIPIIVMAGYKAFGRAVSIRTDGVFVSDVLGFDSTRMFLDPERHEIEVHSDLESEIDYLSEVAYLFSHERPGDYAERVRFASNAIAAWRVGIADGARKSKRLTDNARKLLQALMRAEDPATLVLHTIPDVLGKGSRRGERLKSAVKALEGARNAVDGLVEGYLRDAVEVVADVLRLSEPAGALEGVQGWVNCLDVAGLLKREDLKLTDKAILRIARETSNGRYTPESLARAVSSILLQRGVEKWQDDTREHLRKELRECRLRIESAAMDVDTPPAELAPIIRSRIDHLEKQLLRIEGGK